MKDNLISAIANAAHNKERKKAQAAYGAKAYLAVERYGVSEEQSLNAFKNRGFGKC